MCCQQQASMLEWQTCGDRGADMVPQSLQRVSVGCCHKASHQAKMGFKHLDKAASIPASVHESFSRLGARLRAEKARFVPTLRNPQLVNPGRLRRTDLQVQLERQIAQSQKTQITSSETRLWLPQEDASPLEISTKCPRHKSWESPE